MGQAPDNRYLSRIHVRENVMKMVMACSDGGYNMRRAEGWRRTGYTREDGTSAGDVSSFCKDGKTAATRAHKNWNEGPC